MCGCVLLCSRVCFQVEIFRSFSQAEPEKIDSQRLYVEATGIHPAPCHQTKCSKEDDNGHILILNLQGQLPGLSDVLQVDEEVCSQNVKVSILFFAVSAFPSNTLRIIRIR